MSAQTVVLLGSPWRGAAAWLRDANRRSWLVRILVVLALVVAAYHYTLLTLLRTMLYETPLAYLGLVPFMSLGMALLLAPQRVGEPAIHDRQIDYIVGLPLIGLALAVTTLLPARLSTMFWIWRIDLLSLPVFVAGLVATVCGVRALWRVRLSIGVLLLAWPLPYSYLLTHWLDGFTASTIAAVRSSLNVLHVAEALQGPDGLFRVVSHGQPYVVSIASACSGVDGLVGFLLVALPLMTLVRGPRWRKALWLTIGLLLVWALNVVRILLILQAGQKWGERVAISGLHPVVGLLLFGVGLVLLVLLMPLLGLRMDPRRPARGHATADHQAAARPLRFHGRAAAGLATVLVPTLLLAAANAGMAQYSLVASDLGAPRLVSFSTSVAQVPGFSERTLANYPWAGRFFGSGSDWTRYLYLPSDAAADAPPITVDVVRADSLDALTAYGVEDCYSFHHYDLRGTTSVDLGGGITGNAISYRAEGEGWEAQYWIWPVRHAGHTSYERIVLLIPTGSGGLSAAGPRPNSDPLRGLGLGVYAAARRAPAGGIPMDSRSTQAYLAGFGRLLVDNRDAVPTAAR
jgi:exosortase/archaeosortase family protein